MVVWWWEDNYKCLPIVHIMLYSFLKPARRTKPALCESRKLDDLA